MAIENPLSWRPSVDEKKRLDARLHELGVGYSRYVRRLILRDLDGLSRPEFEENGLSGVRENHWLVDFSPALVHSKRIILIPGDLYRFCAAFRHRWSLARRMVVPGLETLVVLEKLRANDPNSLQSLEEPDLMTLALLAKRRSQEAESEPIGNDVDFRILLNHFNLDYIPYFCVLSDEWLYMSLPQMWPQDEHHPGLLFASESKTYSLVESRLRERCLSGDSMVDLSNEAFALGSLHIGH